jgi:hypothetical protein
LNASIDSSRFRKLAGGDVFAGDFVLTGTLAVVFITEPNVAS